MKEANLMGWCFVWGCLTLICLVVLPLNLVAAWAARTALRIDAAHIRPARAKQEGR